MLRELKTQFVKWKIAKLVHAHSAMKLKSGYLFMLIGYLFMLIYVKWKIATLVHAHSAMKLNRLQSGYLISALFPFNRRSAR